MTDVEHSIDAKRLTAWLEDTNAWKSALFFNPVAARDPGWMVFPLIARELPGISWGIQEGDLAVGFFFFTIDKRAFALLFCRSLEKIEDVKEAAREALGYSENSAGSFTTESFAPLSDDDESVLYSLSYYQACLLHRLGQSDKARQVYEHILEKAKKWDALFSPPPEGKKSKDLTPYVHVLAALHMAQCYVQTGNYKEAVEVLSPAISVAEADLKGMQVLMAMYQILGFCQMQMGNMEEARESLKKALRQPVVDWEYKKVLAEARGLLFAVYLQADEYEKLEGLMRDVFADVLQYSPDKTLLSLLLGTMSLDCSAADKPISAIFFSKMALAQVRWEREHHIVSVVKEKDILDLLDILLSAFQREPELKRIRQWKLSDTPAALMVGDEATLYAQYLETSEALREAGRSGSPAEQDKARANFLAWIDSVEQTLDAKE